MLRKSGMTIYKGFAIVDVNFSHTGKVASVVLKDKNFNEKFVEEQKLAGKPRSRTEEKEDGDDGTRLIPCLSLLCCGPKQCGPDVFTAVNESGLVYDGGLVVDEVRVHSLRNIVFIILVRLRLQMSLILLHVPVCRDCHWNSHAGLCFTA